MWDAEVLARDALDENRVWVRVPRPLPHDLAELVGTLILIDGAVRAIADVQGMEPGRSLGPGDPLGLVLDPLTD